MPVSDPPDPGSHNWGDDSMPVVLHRLASLERRVDEGFSRLDLRLDSLGFVRVDVYEAEKEAQAQRFLVLEKAVADARRPGVWAMSTLGGAFIVAVVGAIVRLGVGG
jgi:hypothetical protein